MKAIFGHDKLDHIGNSIFSRNDHPEGRPLCRPGPVTDATPTVLLPVIDPPADMTIFFPFPSMRWVATWTGLFIEEGAQAKDLDRTFTGWSSQ